VAQPARTVVLSLAEAERLAAGALAGSGAAPEAAAATAKALVAAEADGQFGHGLSRVSSYAAQVRVGKIDGAAVPVMTQHRPSVLRIDAKGGFAYPALDLALGALEPLARQYGLAAAGVFASHHIGQAGRSAERLADQGLIGLVMSNTPRAMAFAGGARAMMGTNPLAFAAPAPGRPPIVIDMALSLVARSRIVAAENVGDAIPAGWATNRRGQGTTDPGEALAGALSPIGGAKGAALALMVEILCAALVGGAYGWEASSFLDDKGAPPGVGQLILALDPGAFSGPDFLPRMTGLLLALAQEEGVRVPGDRRLAARATAQVAGLPVSKGLHDEIRALAGATRS